MKPPHEIRVASDRRRLTLTFPDSTPCSLDAEYLRVFSPSAEVRGHGPDDKVLQTGKRNVMITNIEPVGNYAIRITYSDGHDSGIYTWRYLKELCDSHETKWAEYLAELEVAGAGRE